MTHLEFLRSVDGFQSLSDDQLAVIDSFCSEKEFQQGDRLFKDGDVVSCLWVVKEGTIDLRFDLPGRDTSEENTIFSIRENRIIGWSSLSPPYKYKLSAYCASSRCHMVLIERKKFLEFLKENPKIGYPVLSAMLRLVGGRFQWLKDSASETLPATSRPPEQSDEPIPNGQIQKKSLSEEEMVSLDFLEKVEVFKGLGDGQLQTIRQCVELAEFKRGERIFTQGTASTHVWIVVDGDVELRTEPFGQDVSSAEPAVSFLSEAHAFGWTCHAPPYKYQLSGYCASRVCKIIKLKREDLNQIFEDDEAIGFQVMLYLIGVVGKQFLQLQDAIAKKRGIEIMSQW